MGTSFYLQRGSDEENRLHVCRRSGASWKFQGVYPSSDFVVRMGRNTGVYYFADEFRDFLPEEVVAITSVADWLYVLENLPEGVVLVDDNESGESAKELVEEIMSLSPEPLDEVLAREYVFQDEGLRAISRSLAQDDFVDSRGWRFTYRKFS